MARTIKQRDINLLTALDRSRKKTGTNIGTKIAVILSLLVVVCALAAVGVYYYLQIAELSSQRDDAFLYINDATTQQKLRDADIASADATEMELLANAIKDTIPFLDTYPKLTGDTYKDLYTLAGTTVKITNIGYDWNTGVLTFDGRCTTATRVPIFIATLRMSKQFKDVTYQGYEGKDEVTEGKLIENEDGSTTQTYITTRYYDFRVLCLMFAPGETPGETTGSAITQ
ncbi:MAG: hypothetical protein LBN36_04380 [Clostridiales Family XIII bacterium]|jgi:Tfp pilus assembly protein PilN|nr:hypothetical protein [Clostridiales Family XIII bacterium]